MCGSLVIAGVNRRNEKPAYSKKKRTEKRFRLESLYASVGRIFYVVFFSPEAAKYSCVININSFWPRSFYEFVVVRIHITGSALNKVPHFPAKYAKTSTNENTHHHIIILSYIFSFSNTIHIV